MLHLLNKISNISTMTLLKKYTPIQIKKKFEKVKCKNN